MFHRVRRSARVVASISRSFRFMALPAVRSEGRGLPERADSKEGRPWRREDDPTISIPRFGLVSRRRSSRHQPAPESSPLPLQEDRCRFKISAFFLSAACLAIHRALFRSSLRSTGAFRMLRPLDEGGEEMLARSSPILKGIILQEGRFPHDS